MSSLGGYGGLGLGCEKDLLRMTETLGNGAYLGPEYEFPAE
jgi:hypothetical protein